MLWQGAQHLRDSVQHAVRGRNQPEMYPATANQRRYQVLNRLATQLQVPISHVVLAYLTSQPIRTVPIVGPQTQSQLADCVAASALRLTPAQLAEIEA